MCGRIFQTLPLSRLLKIARTKKHSNQNNYYPSYNIAPTSHLPVIRSSKLYELQDNHNRMVEQQPNQINRQRIIDKEVQNLYSQQQSQKQKQQNNNNNDRELTFMKWGFTDKRSNFVINARIQQMLGKRMFMNIIENRCVVIMEGYYQWTQKKEPYSFTRNKFSNDKDKDKDKEKDKNKNKDKDKEENNKQKKNLNACDHLLAAALYTNQNQIVILTKDAITPLNKVHHRMPVLLKPQQVQMWLDPKNTQDISTIIQGSLLNDQNRNQYFGRNISFQKLAPHVNSVKQKSKKCLMTVEEYKKQLDKTGLMRFWGKKNNKKEQPDESIIKQKQNNDEDDKGQVHQKNLQKQKEKKIQKEKQKMISEKQSSENPQKQKQRQKQKEKTMPKSIELKIKQELKTTQKQKDQKMINQDKQK